MRFTFSNNPIDRLSCWFHNSIVEPLSRYHDRHKKTHYECCVCGLMHAPYFEGQKYSSIRYDYGWHKLDDGHRWICHHCADHGFALNAEKDIPIENGMRDYTWDEWQELFVDPNREYIAKLIEEKDPEYYKREILYEGLFEEDDDESF